MSENCDCIIHLVDFNEPPTVANMFNRECSWRCKNETCVPDNILEVFVTRKKKNPTKPISETTTDHTEAWPTTRDSITRDRKEAWPTTTVRVTTNSKEPHSEQNKDLGNYLEKMDVFMTVFWTVSGLFVAYISPVVGKMICQSRQQKQPYLPITRSQQDSTVTTQIPTLDITPSFEIPTIIPVPEISTQRPTVPRMSSLRSIEDIPPIFTLRTYSSSSETESFNRESSPEPCAPPMEDPTPP